MSLSAVAGEDVGQFNRMWSDAVRCGN